MHTFLKEKYSKAMHLPAQHGASLLRCQDLAPCIYSACTRMHVHAAIAKEDGDLPCYTSRHLTFCTLSAIKCAEQHLKPRGRAGQLPQPRQAPG